MLLVLDLQILISFKPAVSFEALFEFPKLETNCYHHGNIYLTVLC